MGVTAIKQIRNTTPAEVLVRSREAKKTVTLPPFQGVGVDIWIPWCNSLDDLRNGHVLEIYQIFELIGIRVYFYIWQKTSRSVSLLTAHGPRTARVCRSTALPAGRGSSPSARMATPSRSRYGTSPDAVAHSAHLGVFTSLVDAPL